MENCEVSHHETAHEPVKPMDEIVVVHVTPEVRKSEITIVIVGMHASGDKYAESFVKVVYNRPSVGRMMVKHYKDKAEVHNSYNSNDTPKPLPWVEEVKVIWLKIVIGTHEDAY